MLVSNKILVSLKRPRNPCLGTPLMQICGVPFFLASYCNQLGTVKIWKQYEASEDFLVTVSACHLGLFAFRNGKNIDKVVQVKATRRSLRSTLAGIRLRIWYFGHLMFSPPPHISYHRLRHLKQKLCRQESCLGSVYKSEHTEQETSPQRL